MPRQPRHLEPVGKTYGRLITTARAPDGPHGEIQWRCQCACGQTTTVRQANLLYGRSTSCGCQARATNRERHLIHGQKGTQMYRLWRGMIARCHYPSQASYKNYGGRGIYVCDLWRMSFSVFLANVLAEIGARPSPAHSIDRIDNDKGYEPGNIRWSTREVQLRNSRRYTTIVYQGRAQLLTDWARELGLPYKTLSSRLCHGWTVEEMFTTPIPGRRRSKRPQSRRATVASSV